MIRRSALLAALAVAALGLPAEARSYMVNAQCNFFGANGTIVVTGEATALSPGESKVPLYTEVTCTVTNVPAGGTATATTSTGLPGAAAATATAVPFPLTLPITVCVRARGIFGPLNPVEIVRPTVCF